MCKLVTINTNFNTSVAVASVKQSVIQFMVDTASDCARIDAIILFGSSLEERCKKRSDIDIAIISRDTLDRLCKQKSFRNFKERLYRRDMAQEYDFLYFKSYDDILSKTKSTAICKEIIDKGMLIYQKKVA